MSRRAYPPSPYETSLPEIWEFTGEAKILRRYVLFPLLTSTTWSTLLKKVAVVLVELIGAAVGAVAGHFVKGKPLDGAIYGGLLGLLGVGVFLLVVEDIRVKCPACLAVVNRGASRCKNCGGPLQKC